jgi:hypothetical protein
MADSWLKKRAQEAAQALEHKPRMAGIHPIDIAEAIEAVAREAMERALRTIVTEWNGIECGPQASCDKIVAEAIAAAEAERYDGTHTRPSCGCDFAIRALIEETP